MLTFPTSGDVQQNLFEEIGLKMAPRVQFSEDAAITMGKCEQGVMMDEDAKPNTTRRISFCGDNFVAPRSTHVSKDCITQRGCEKILIFSKGKFANDRLSRGLMYLSSRNDLGLLVGCLVLW